MLQDLIVPLILVGLAELGDKTQLAILVLSTKTKKYLALLLGVMAAFSITTGLAIILGNFISTVVPMEYVSISAGLLFILFGLLMLVSKEDEETNVNPELNNPFLTGFGLILVAEMGDKTQIATAVFATQYDPYLVFIGVILALFIMTMIAIYIGQFIMDRIRTSIISKAAGILFILIGASFFI
ncbi:protein of unknown function UPF0016 [Methanosalsum zhilinae DSM 4017]|uniref:Uncharacterized protein n=1 Tax=Methanosalsum zhilinae (strain DSM 4017 / NBRC 107636 / OCM 62 / WeN5) TaxID=679901 RepID=F7XKX6_METZD|nr:TMEM165/GDT1 family protein [Methanosalsum zhilinae]AEH60674.1 protein of unknown function UPF0016 [Methanosalsum zhilinae DSM 4017]